MASALSLLTHVHDAARPKTCESTSMPRLTGQRRGSRARRVERRLHVRSDEGIAESPPAHAEDAEHFANLVSVGRQDLSLAELPEHDFMAPLLDALHEARPLPPERSARRFAEDDAEKVRGHAESVHPLVSTPAVHNALQPELAALRAHVLGEGAVEPRELRACGERMGVLACGALVGEGRPAS